MTLTELQSKLDQQKGKKLELENDISSLEKGIKKKERDFKRHEKAHEIVRIVGKMTQEQLQFHISDLASLALLSIFDNPYELLINFEERRGKTECDILFKREDKVMKPIDSSGGGTVDVASFALRIASWSMTHPRRRATILLDEPFRYLSQDRQEAASQMLKEISNRMGIQFIIITHEEILASYADKTFKVIIKNGKTKIT